MIRTGSNAALVLALIVGAGCASGPESGPASEEAMATGRAAEHGLPEGGNPDRAENGEASGFEEDLFYGEDEETAPAAFDPIEGFNRGVFVFNDFVYTNVFDPVATGYDWVMPNFAQTGIRNFFRNLGMPIRFTGSVLQGKGKRAGKEVGAFLINSTWGILGFRQPSKKVFGEIPREDLGQAISSWGLGNGPYLVLPILGPSTAYDTVGLVGEWYLYPVTYIDDFEIEAALYGLDFVNLLPPTVEQYKEIDAMSVDPYTAFRDAYLKNRQFELDR